MLCCSGWPGTQYVTQVALNYQFSCLSFLNLGITGVSYYAHVMVNLSKMESVALNCLKLEL